MSLHRIRASCFFSAARILARKKNGARQILAVRFQFLRERLIMRKLSRENIFHSSSYLSRARCSMPERVCGCVLPLQFGEPFFGSARSGKSVTDARSVLVSDL